MSLVDTPGQASVPYKGPVSSHFNLLFLQQCIAHVAPCIWLPESVACVCVSPGLRLSAVLIMQSDSAGPLRASLYGNTLKIIRPSCLGLNGLPARPVCVCVCLFKQTPPQLLNPLTAGRNHLLVPRSYRHFSLLEGDYYSRKIFTPKKMASACRS